MISGYVILIDPPSFLARRRREKFGVFTAAVKVKSIDFERRRRENFGVFTDAVEVNSIDFERRRRENFGLFPCH